MQKAKTDSKIDQMEGIIEEHRQLQGQLKEEQAKNKELEGDLRKANKDLQMFEPYREFISEEVPKVWTIELRSKFAIDNLRKLERAIYGGQIQVLQKEQDEITKDRAWRMNHLVEKAIAYVCRDNGSINIFRNRMIREPGDAV